ncbi:hypothetical protein AXG93_1962s1080 [Marchantia polymorpha subsp. ruderalis]|uniref:DAGKc domain-containing protein n=1 Tax=Marchantia polymorpha subsp. ruderalis TaxID=1480154 RepID=A0A176WF68_MARPO|nr:hypothetical protein AXG93_1962s1080 [Marchantia polymorpha subsp. ruderalis]
MQVIGQLLSSRKQKEQDKNNLKLIEDDIKRILRATGSQNPLFQEANRGIIFSKSFNPKDWRKKKRQDPIFADIAYFNFWSLMLAPDIATAFMEALLTRINDMDIEEEINPEHMKKSIGPQREWDFGKEYEVKDAEPYSPGHPLVTRTFKIFTKIPAEFLNHIFGNCLQQYFVQNSVGSNGDNILHLQVLNFMKWDQSERLTNLDTFLYQYAGYMGCKSSTVDNSLIGTGWVYLWLQQEVLNGNGQLVVAGIRGALAIIAREDTVLTPVSEFQIMCLLTTLNGIVSLVHLNDENQDLGRFIAELYADFFEPIHEIGRGTAKILQNEHKAPGEPSRLLPPSTHVVLNTKCPRSYNLTALLHATPLEAEGEPYDDTDYIHYTRWRLILQMLCCCGVEEVVTESQAYVPLVISQQPPDFVASVYERLLQIMEEAVMCEDHLQAAQIRAHKVKDIWDELCQTLGLRDLIMPEVEIALIDDLPTNRLNPMRFTTIKAEPTWQPNKNVMTSGTAGGLPRFSRTGAEDILFDIISRSVDLNAYQSPEYMAFRLHGVKEVVRVMVGGGDGTLNYMLAGFVNLHYYGELLPLGFLEKLDVRFYILPTGEVNSLAGYIARNDLWYDANINRMLTSRLPAVPHVGDPKECLDDPSGSKHRGQQQQQMLPDLNTVSPRNLLTKQIENYVLEAKNVFHVSIYACEAWYHDGQTETYCTIPFFGRAEIGITAAMVSPMGERQLGQHAGAPRPARAAAETIEELAARVALSVSITYTGLGLEFEELPQTNMKGSYISIMVINVPKPHEQRLACEPWSDYMDFFVLDSAHQVVQDKKIKSLSDIAYWSRPEMANWISIEAIRSMEEESPRNFDVLLDGEVFGPFHRVTFSPCAHPVNRKTNLKLPVATFWRPENSRFK